MNFFSSHKVLNSGLSILLLCTGLLLWITYHNVLQIHNPENHFWSPLFFFYLLAFVTVTLFATCFLLVEKHRKRKLADHQNLKINQPEINNISDAVKTSNEQLRALSGHLQSIREEERSRLAKEIHDDLGQQLTGLKMDISWLNRKIDTTDKAIKEKISGTLLLIDHTIKIVRKIATELRPSILDDLGLVAAMEWQSAEFEKLFDIKINFTNMNEEPEVNADIATCIFRVYEESVTNIALHASAKNVSATLSMQHNSLQLTIVDDGCGFDVQAISNKTTFGLLSMQERTLKIGGTYQITSKPGYGTSVLVSVPYLPKNKPVQIS